MAYLQINGGSALTSAFVAQKDSFFEPARGNMVANSFAEFPLGGSRTQPCHEGGGYTDAVDFVDFELSSALYSGATFEALVEVRVENAGITITPKIRNVTDSTDAVVGSASTSTTGGSAGQIWASQTLSFTPTVGKKYRLQLVKSADTYAAWAIGRMRRRGT